MTSLADRLRFVLPVLLAATPLSAWAHPDLVEVAWLTLGMMYPLALCIIILCIYLPFSRYSWPDCGKLLGVFGIGVLVMATIVYHLPGKASHVLSFLVWLVPLVVVLNYRKRL